jgi:type IX secretion system PorP/SprF family membrane protein
MGIRVFFVGLFFSASLCSVFGQQDPQFSHYMFNGLYINPAYASVEGVSRATLIHRSQWLGYSGTNPADQSGGAPSTQMLSANYPFKILSSPTFNSGAGLVVVNDRLGPLRNIIVKGSFAYNIELGTGGTLSAGARLGLWSQKIDVSLLRPAEDGDLIVDGFGAGNVSQTKPDFGLGVWYNSTKYWAGISLNHAFRSTFTFNVDPETIGSKLHQHLYVTGGYNFFFGSRLIVSPSAIIQTDFSETSFNYGAIAQLDKYKYWGGITLRQSIADNPTGENGKQWVTDDFVLLLGMSFLDDNKLRAGYAFDLVSSGAAAKNPTSHEIMISYIIPVLSDKKEPIIRTPRYRYVD